MGNLLRRNRGGYYFQPNQQPQQIEPRHSQDQYNRIMEEREMKKKRKKENFKKTMVLIGKTPKVVNKVIGKTKENVNKIRKLWKNKQINIVKVLYIIQWIYSNFVTLLLTSLLILINWVSGQGISLPLILFIIIEFGRSLLQAAHPIIKLDEGSKWIFSSTANRTLLIMRMCGWYLAISLLTQTWIYIAIKNDLFFQTNCFSVQMIGWPCVFDSPFSKGYSIFLLGFHITPLILLWINWVWILLLLSLFFLLPKNVFNSNDFIDEPQPQPQIEIKIEKKNKSKKLEDPLKELDIYDEEGEDEDDDSLIRYPKVEENLKEPFLKNKIKRRNSTMEFIEHQIQRNKQQQKNSRTPYSTYSTISSYSAGSNKTKSKSYRRNDLNKYYFSN